MVTRRKFLQVSAAAVGTSVLSSVRWPFGTSVALAAYQSPGLQKFVQPLRGVGPGGIPVAAPDSFPAPVTGATHYTLSIGQYTDTLHPALGPTTLWGYKPAVPLGGGNQPQKHLGGIIVAQKGTPIQLTFANKLPNNHILPVDVTDLFPEATTKFGGKGMNAASTHLHGGFVPWISDGGPLAWFTPAASGGNYGTSAQFGGTNIFKLLNPNLGVGQAEYFYPNQQSARLLWYHDHAHDITRLNAYAGIATAYVLRDGFEANLRNLGLPDFVENGGREIPLVIQDKVFVGPNISQFDPTWPSYCPQTAGSLWYPHIYDADTDPPGTVITVDPSCVPEMFGDTMLANGTVYPEATVEARRYRFRILNACQARFLNLQLYVDDGSPDGITLSSKTFAPTNAKGPDFLVLGTEGGFLPKPVLVRSNVPFNEKTMGGSLITAPAERWDLLVDFSGYAGKKIILYTDAPAPFPSGDDTNDYFPGNPENPTQPQPGFGPNTRQIMRFKVGPATSQDPALGIMTSTDLTQGNEPLPVPLGITDLPPGVPVRQLTLNEGFDHLGRLIQTLGTNQQGTFGFGRAYMDMATETPKAGTTEVWEIANLTGDTHPIHFHLVNVQIISRQPFDVKHYYGAPSYTGPAQPPAAVESGWKETVKMNPGEVTRVIMTFNLPQVPISVPSSPMGGAEYVWHCHILEHEEHDMMRPLIVT